MIAMYLAYSNVYVKVKAVSGAVTPKIWTLEPLYSEALPGIREASPSSLFFSCLSLKDPASSYLESHSYLTFYHMCMCVHFHIFWDLFYFWTDLFFIPLDI